MKFTSNWQAYFVLPFLLGFARIIICSFSRTLVIKGTRDEDVYPAPSTFLIKFYECAVTHP